MVNSKQQVIFKKRVNNYKDVCSIHLIYFDTLAHYVVKHSISQQRV